MLIQVGNLDETVNDWMLARLFAPFGEVREARVTRHSETGHSTGIGCIDMTSDEAGDLAILALNRQLRHGRVLTVCGILHGAEPPHRAAQMFESMNLIEKSKVKSPIERRGLPDEGRQ